MLIKDIYAFLKFAFTYTQAEEFESCSYLGSTSCSRCPQFKECVSHFS